MQIAMKYITDMVICTLVHKKKSLNIYEALPTPIGGVFLCAGAYLGQYWGNKNKKPTTTWVAGLIMETAGVH